jgi:taurine dioxygenase
MFLYMAREVDNKRGPMDAVKTSPLEPFGLALNIDLRLPLEEPAQAELRALLAEHDLLLFQNQGLTMDDQVRVMGYLGDVLQSPEGRGQIRHDNGLGTSPLAFHSDLAFSPEPLRALSLHALQVGETATRFAHARGAYSRLTDQQRALIEGTSALHVWPTELGSRNRDAVVDSRFPRSTHPVVWRQPGHEAPILFICENSTDSLHGFSPADSEALLTDLFAGLYSPEFILEHHWNAGDLLIWDNIAVQHGRAGIAQHGPRILQRVALGRFGLADQHPELAQYFK